MWLVNDDDERDDDDEDDVDPVINSIYKSGPVEITVMNRLLLHSWAMIGEVDDRPS